MLIAAVGFRLKRKDGTIFSTSHAYTCARQAGTSPDGLASSRTLPSASGRRRSLRESEERFRATFENAGVGMALVDLQGHPIKSNPALRQMLGYSEEELSRMAFTEFTHPDDRDLDWGLFSELTAGKRDKYEIEKRYLKKGGGVVWGLLTASLVKDRHGRPTVRRWHGARHHRAQAGGGGPARERAIQSRGDRQCSRRRRRL